MLLMKSAKPTAPQQPTETRFAIFRVTVVAEIKVTRVTPLAT
jgi:hypothetical protein